MADVKISALPAGTAQPTGLIPVVNGGTTQRVTVKQLVDLALATVPSGTINTVGNPVGLPEDPAMPVQTWAEQMVLKAAFKDTDVTFARVQATSPDWNSGDVFGNGNVIANGGAFGELWYGALLARDGKMTSPGYQMPLPTGDGYLRSDTDPVTGWYFAEPVLISDTEPPAPTGGNAIWVDPTASPTTETNLPFSNVNPPVYLDAPITETATSPLGIVNNEYIEPDVVGAVPVVVNGKRYLLPLLEAPASTATRTPLFSFADEPVKQQADGSWIGLDNTGMNYYQPETLAAVPILVGGKKYLLPLIAE
jgi:hypothetical protein